MAISRAWGTPAVIDVHDLNKSFGDQARRRRSLAARQQGEIFGFLGPNGSGKTTSIRLMCGLLTPDSGSGTCLGYDIRTQSELDQAQRRLHDAAVLVLGGPDDPRESRLHRTRLRDGRSPRGGRSCDRGAGPRRPRSISSPARCPAAGSSGSRSPRACSTSRACCCSTSRPRASIRTRGANSGRSCIASRRRGSRCSSARTTWTRPSAATSSHTSRTAACWCRAPRNEVIAAQGLTTCSVRGPDLTELAEQAARAAGRRADRGVRRDRARDGQGRGAPRAHAPWKRTAAGGQEIAAHRDRARGRVHPPDAGRRPTTSATKP